MHIFVDWGSTNFRAFLMQGQSVIDRRSASGHGILQSFAKAPAAERKDYYALFLQNQLATWLAEFSAAEIIMCGAVGSREGWIDTGYTEAPADFEKLAGNLRRLNPEECSYLEKRHLSILPGLSIGFPNGRYDVMRSEEIKALGAADYLKMDNAVLCIPGTHCKWVRIENRQIVDFHSVVTGELYSILSEHGCLAPLFGEDTSDKNSFDSGFFLSRTGNDLLADIFQVRSQALRSKNPPEDLRSYFSGILLGHEMRQISSLWGGLKDVVLLSDSGPRRQLYRRALDLCGWTVAHEIESELAVCHGLSRLKT